MLVEMSCSVVLVKLIAPVLHKNEENYPSIILDVGFPYVCCEYVLLPLVNKETSLVYVRAEYSKVGNPSRDRRGTKEVSDR